MAKINVKGTEIAIFNRKEEDYICITDIARYKDSQRTDYIIQNWLRNRNTIEFLGIWELLNNPGFKPIEFDGFKKQAGNTKRKYSQALHMAAYRLVFQRLCASIAFS